MTHPQPLRAAIIDRAAKLDKSASDVAELVSGSISRSQVYRYWSGECDLTSTKIDRNRTIRNYGGLDQYPGSR